MKIFKTGEKGFTLIELLVVISILGVLAAVVILNVTKYIGSGRTEAARTELANVQTAVSAYLYGDGFINIVIPTSGVLMSVIAMSKIPYFKWLKFALPLCGIWILLGAVAIAYSTWVGW